jgi:hypothetical protein
MNRFERELKKQQHNLRTQEMASEEDDHERDKDENTVPFDQVEKVIIAFVESKRQEEGPKQRQIVEEIQKNHASMTGTSRVSLLKRIEALVKYKVLVERPDPENRQTKRYYVNKESLLITLHNYFDNFESALITLVKAFVEKNGGPVTGQKPEEIMFFTVIFELYQHVRGIAMTHATFSWGKITNDPILLNKLHRTLFAKLIRLQENLSKALEEAGVDTFRNFVSSSWMMRPEVIDEGITVAQKYDLPKEAVSPVFDLAWSIGAPVAKYARVKFEKDLPAQGIGEIADENDARIDKWNSSRGWTEAYLYWKEQKEQQQQQK